MCYKLLIRNAFSKFFFTEPTKSHYLIDISRKINLAHTSVKKELDVLVKYRFISKKKFSEFPQELKNNIIKGFVISRFLEVFNDNKNNP